MNISVADILVCIQGVTSLFKAEVNILQLVFIRATELVGLAFEQLDDQLYEKAKEEAKQKHQTIKSLGRDSRTISFLFGTVQFKRRYIQMADGSRVYLLDQQLGIQPHRQFSQLLMEKISDLTANGTMRLVAKAINSLTNCSISAPAVDRIAQGTGSDIALVRIQQTKEEEETEPSQRKALRVLYIEGDAFLVRGRCTKGKKHRGHRRRNVPFTHTVHRFQIYEGIEKNGSRHTLVNRHDVSGLSQREAIRELEAYLGAHYDLSQTTVFTGSDNGSGYEPEVFANIVVNAAKHIHVLDRYHLNNKITMRLAGFPEPVIKKVRKAVYTANWDALTQALDTCQSLAVNDSSSELGRPSDRAEDVRLLRGYLERNWVSIKPIADPALHESIHSLGCCESNHRRYTYRLKREGRAWSKRGLEAMLRIIDCEQNEDLIETLNETEMLGTTFAPEVDETAEDDVNLQALGLFKAQPTTHVGVRHASLGGNVPASSPMGQLNKKLNMGGLF